MRLFLYTYDDPKNYTASVWFGILGAKIDDAGLEQKVRRLRSEDIILVHDGSAAGPTFLGAGRVVGQVFRKGPESPFKDLLWPDEQFLKKVLYPLRVSVDFKNGPRIARNAPAWSDLAALGLRNDRGQPLTEPQQWGKKLYGNFLDVPSEVTAMCELLQIGST